MRQKTFAENGFERYHKQTRREIFLAEMNDIIPWRELSDVIEPFYPKADGAGRPPIGIERMLRIHFLQHWFNLSDPAVEEAFYESRSMRGFVGIDLGQEPAPDETTICKFRHVLEANNLGERLFKLIREYLAENGLKVASGTIVDATIIAAPSSTKNSNKKRDPEIRQTKKGNQWHFGMKAHIGVDSRTKLIHSVVATPANVHDSRVLPRLLHGDEYGFFCAVTTFALLPVWTDIKLLIANPLNADMLYQVATHNHLQNIVIFLFIISITLKRKTLILKRISILLFAFAIVVYAVLIALALQNGHYQSFSSFFIFCGALVIMLIWIIIYLFSADAGTAFKLLTKKGVIFFVVMYLFLRLPKYISNKILSDYLSNTTFSPTLSDFTELKRITSLSIYWSVFSSIILFLIFLFIYIRFKDNFFKSPSRI